MTRARMGVRTEQGERHLAEFEAHEAAARHKDAVCFFEHPIDVRAISNAKCNRVRIDRVRGNGKVLSVADHPIHAACEGTTADGENRVAGAQAALGAHQGWPGPLQAFPCQPVAYPG